MYTQSAPEVHDVIVIGSGAAGPVFVTNVADPDVERNVVLLDACE